MNSCQRVDALISAYLEDEASPAEHRFVEGHLTACAGCRSSVEAVSRLMTQLSRLPKVPASAGFTDAVLAKTRGLAAAGLEELVVVPHPHSARSWQVPLAAAATLAIVLLGSTQLFKGGDTPTFTQIPTSPPAIEVQTEPAAQTTDELAAVSPPEVNSLDQLYPNLNADAESQSLGMFRDAYVIEDYQLMEPTGGGTPILSRVGEGADSQVLVTF